MISPTAIMTEETSRGWRPSIPGWADDILPFYQQIAETLPNGGTFVEVGVCAGRSIVYLASRLILLGKLDVHLFAVDSWQGKNFRAQLLETYVRGRANTDEIDMIKPIAFEGARAARLFDDLTVDGVFIDSDHEYPGMIEHLQAWVPKVRPGGIIAGHDYSKADWPGVVQAVDEYFGSGGLGAFVPAAVEHPTRSVWLVRL